MPVSTSTASTGLSSVSAQIYPSKRYPQPMDTVADVRLQSHLDRLYHDQPPEVSGSSFADVVIIID